MHSLDYRFRKLKRGALARLALLSRRFDPWLKTDAPLARIEYFSGADTKRLLIFLPGIGDLAEDFERQGFIADMRRQQIDADAIAVDAHYGYYASRAIHARITGDIVGAARAAGYERIWLAGVSLGGFGAASYAARHAADIAGLLLLAPYLGDQSLIREIAAAGGVRQWTPGTVDAADHPRLLWSWFRENIAHGNTAPPIYLGYGQRDWFSGAHALLADVLPEQQVVSIPGGHDWRTWKRLWQMTLPDWKNRLD